MRLAKQTNFLLLVSVALNIYLIVDKLGTLPCNVGVSLQSVSPERIKIEKSFFSLDVPSKLRKGGARVINQLNGLPDTVESLGPRKYDKMEQESPRRNDRTRAENVQDKRTRRLINKEPVNRNKHVDQFPERNNNLEQLSSPKRREHDNVPESHIHVQDSPGESLDRENKVANQNEFGRDHHILAVAVMTAPKNVDRRQVIRETWKNGYEQRNHYVKFVLGTDNLDTESVQELEKENSEHKDLVLLADLQDSYNKLSHKVLATLVWFDQNVNYSYLLKCDDDTFPMLDQLEDELFRRKDTRGLYWGYFLPASRPMTEGKWAENNWKFCDTYFPYAAGGGYILSADVIHRISSNADAMIVYNNEDVSVGSWTVSYDIERKHDVRFDTETYSRGCNNSFVVFHKQTVEDALSKHDLYRTTGLLCEHEFLLVEFEYDWNVLPAKAHKHTCCRIMSNFPHWWVLFLLCMGLVFSFLVWRLNRRRTSTS